MIFSVRFSYFVMLYVFVLWFGIFPIKFGCIDERMQSESSQGRLNNQNIAGSNSTMAKCLNIASSKSMFWWHMSVILDKFVRFDKIDLGSFFSSKIDRRFRIWASEKLKPSRSSQIIEKNHLNHLAVVQPGEGAKHSLSL